MDQDQVCLSTSTRSRLVLIIMSCFMEADIWSAPPSSFSLSLSLAIESANCTACPRPTRSGALSLSHPQCSERLSSAGLTRFGTRPLFRSDFRAPHNLLTSPRCRSLQPAHLTTTTTSMSTAFSAEVERATREILASDDKVEELWGRAQTHLRVFTMEKYASVDIPDWVRRVSEHPAHHVLTVQKLITAMYVTADDLGLDQGKRYVAAAVCACASEAANRNMDQDGDGEDTKNMALATALQGLASTWAAYLLWPCACFPPSHATVVLSN